MFKKTARRGLVNRLVSQRGVPLTAALLIAEANYPGGELKDCADLFVVNPAEANAATEAFLDRGAGTLDDLLTELCGEENLPLARFTIYGRSE